LLTKTDARELADSKFKKKEMQLLDGRMAMAEYAAARRAVSENTARLRALRMARDAAAGLAAAENTATPAGRKTKKKPRSEKGQGTSDKESG
jgi:outer membrane protein TolC